jgi:hypothetical protein
MRARELDGLVLGQPREVVALLSACRGGKSEEEGRERGEDG